MYNVLKLAWENYGPVKQTEVDAGLMAFEFSSVKDMERIMDMSPWAIHGHCLNLRSCAANQCADDIDFSTMQCWVQVHGLNFDMMNDENASQIATNIGKCIEIEKDSDMQNR